MQFYEILVRVTGRLILEQRLSYQRLRRDLGLDEAEIADIRTELSFRGLAHDEDGKGLVWTGNSSLVSRVQSRKSKNERTKRRSGDREMGRKSVHRPISLSSPEECFDKAIEIARQQHTKSLELRAVMSLVRLHHEHALEQGAHTALNEAHRMLSALYTWFTEGFETTDLRAAKALLHELV